MASFVVKGSNCPPIIRIIHHLPSLFHLVSNAVFEDFQRNLAEGEGNVTQILQGFFEVGNHIE